MVRETEDFNIFKYQYFYNGGGIAIADYNNDGLEDVFFTGNMVKNRLFLNKGNLKFEDITIQSKVAEQEGWCTGANAVDINQDGWMDIYVCRAGYPFPDLRKNLLFINNKDNTFTESAQTYGLDDAAHATHSVFFDSDKDGDLDLFLLNHSTPEYSKGNLEIFQLQNKKDAENTNKLYRNDNNKFIDITEEAGITGNVLSFSLGVSVFDINNDNYPDIFVANDFNEHDYLYINQKNNQYIDKRSDWLDNMSMFSMGTDFADIDNNGFQDLVVLDMLPESNHDQKMHAGADNYDKVERLVDNGFGHQFSRNTLHLNNGLDRLIETGQYYGIANTDWSWSALFMDFQNDGLTDLFVSNGYLRDHTDMDFLQYTANQVLQINAGKGHDDFEQYLQSMPPINQPNYFYNQSGDKFENMSPHWNLNIKSVSQGAAYSDLDNDGDLDLVVNNSGEYSFLYENYANQNDNNWLTIKLSGDAPNRNAIGAKVILYFDDQVVQKELQPSRGFQSTSTQKLHFGTGELSSYDSIAVIWPDESRQVVTGLTCCQELNIEKSSSRQSAEQYVADNTSVFEFVDLGIDYLHKETTFRDLTVQPLMPWYQTDVSPKMNQADIDGDGLDDLVVGGSAENLTYVFFQKKNGGFTNQVLSPDYLNVTDICIDDINGDGKLDVVLADGSYRYKSTDSLAAIHILYQTGERTFVDNKIALAGCNPASVCAGDFNDDGQTDLFAGGSPWYNNYPVASSSAIIEVGENGSRVIRYHDIGSVSDCYVNDLHDENGPEIITAGPWNKIRVFNIFSKWKELTEGILPTNYSGFWNDLLPVDTDGDGDLDLIAGNIGENSQLTASKENALKLWYDDVDKNGSIDPIMGYYVIDDHYPFPSREDLLAQIPLLKKDFLSFADYADVTFQELIEISGFKEPSLLTIDTLAHLLFTNENGQLIPQGMPSQLQFAPIYTMRTLDVNADGKTDLYVGGNKKRNLVKIGHLSGSVGTILQNDGDNMFSVLDSDKSGIRIIGEQRGSAVLNINDQMHLIACPIGSELVSYRLNE